MGNIDRKFKIVATNTINGKTYTEDNAIVFCAHDQALLPTLQAYLFESARLNAAPQQLQSIEALIARVKAYQESHKTKVADLTDEEAKVLLQP